MDGWIEHDGNGFPKGLGYDTLVRVEFKDGIGKRWSAEAAEFWLPDDSDPHNYWLADGSHNDIVAYEVVASID